MRALELTAIDGPAGLRIAERPAPSGEGAVIIEVRAAGVSFPDLLVTNICFGGADMRDAYITLSATGKLIKTRWPRPGLKLNFNA